MGNNPSSLVGPKNPVEMVSWDDCQRFLAKLNANFSRREGRFALPTEAQWEYACRAGNTSRFCCGDDESQLGEYAWYKANSDGKTHPVGQKQPNPWGLYDTHGNVWEWCADWCDESYYAKSPTDDPVGPSEGSGRVARGGSWRSVTRYCRSASRGYGGPERRFCYLGFRASLIPADR
jgi:formylglycine-generating enzyme required for sulfatase activity